MEHRSIAFLLEDVMKGKFDRGFFQEDLWALAETIPVTTVAIADVKHWVYTPCWSYSTGSGKKECFYSIYQVLKQPTQFKADMTRIRKADTKYPLIVIEDEFDQAGTILDGNHRFAKLLLGGAKQIKIKRIRTKDLMKIMMPM